MSSMFKKKGGLAFKPKIPSARARPAAPVTTATTSQPSKAPEPPVQTEVQPQEAPQETSATPSSSVPAIEPVVPEPQSAPEPPSEKSSTPPREVTRPATEDAVSHDTTHNSKPVERDSVPDQLGSEAKDQDDGGDGTAKAAQEPIVQTSAPNVNDAEQTQPLVDDFIPTPIVPQIEQEPVKSPSSQDETSKAPSTVPSDQSPAPQTDITAVASDTQPPAIKPKSRSKRLSTKPVDAEAGDEEETRPKKRQRKTASGGVDAVPKQPRKRKTNTQNGGEGKTRPRRARSITPEDSESQIVDHQKLKMADLTRDLHIGKKFSRHDELRERERKARMKSKLGKIGISGDGDETASEVGGGSQDSAKKDSPPAPATTTTTTSSGSAPTASGPQFRIVDGQIVVDQSSLVMDRHARAAATQQHMETVEENEFTRLITSNSFMNTSKLKGPNVWSEAETELFYRGLRMFGTDFEMISKMFPNKQRRHIKLKFNREERHCPRRIDAALVGEKTIKMDINEYKAFTGSEFESVEAIEAQQRKIQEDFEAERQRAADEQAEIMRKKREELFADDDDEDTKKKKGKKKGKKAVRYGLNGEPIAEDS